jgi:hypothetical protein
LIDLGPKRQILFGQQTAVNLAAEGLWRNHLVGIGIGQRSPQSLQQDAVASQRIDAPLLQQRQTLRAIAHGHNPRQRQPPANHIGVGRARYATHSQPIARQSSPPRQQKLRPRDKITHRKIHQRLTAEGNAARATGNV